MGWLSCELDRAPQVYLLHCSKYVEKVSSYPYNSIHAALQHNCLRQLQYPSIHHLKELIMFITADQITASTQANLEAAKDLSAKSFSGAEKLVELNLAAAKATMADSFKHAQSLLSAKDLQSAFALQTALVAPLAENAVAYGRHVYGIAVEAGAEFTKAIEGKSAEAQKAFNQVVENVAKNAPAGSESAVAVVKSALASSQSAIESAQSAAKKSLAMAESNFSAVTEQALSAAASVSKKTK
jgi:phasin family protein